MIKPFKVRQKDSHGRPRSKWVTVYAETEEQAVRNFMDNVLPSDLFSGPWSITPAPKKHKRK